MQVATLPETECSAADFEILLELNRNYVRSAEQSDVAWFEEHLSEDFLNCSVDGQIIDRSEFLTRIARPYPGSRLGSVDPRIQCRRGLAIIQSGFCYKRLDGSEGTGRYTDVWVRRNDRWLCVAAHFNRF